MLINWIKDHSDSEAAGLFLILEFSVWDQPILEKLLNRWIEGL